MLEAPRRPRHFSRRSLPCEIRHKGCMHCLVAPVFNGMKPKNKKSRRESLPKRQTLTPAYVATSLPASAGLLVNPSSVGYFTVRFRTP
jgi:hypothetical protein